MAPPPLPREYSSCDCARNGAWPRRQTYVMGRSVTLSFWHRQEFPGCKGPACEARHADRALEVVDQVHAHANGRATGSLRIEMDLRRPFLHAVDVVPELAAVVHRRHVIPRAQRVQALSIDQRLVGGAAVHEAVGIPSVVDNAE